MPEKLFRSNTYCKARLRLNISEKVKHETLLVHEKLILLRIYNNAGLGYFPLFPTTVSHRIWSCLPLIECLTSETAATPWEAHGVSGE